MPRALSDPAVGRVVTSGFAFPKGSYPVEALTPRPGYSIFFEPADGDDKSGEWEEWPDRYVFDIVISAERVPSLCRSLFALLPSRIYPILDVLGHDAYREIDPYISYDLLGFDRFLASVRAFREYLFDDGLVGFGAMTDDPFFYIFVDEHKIITVRAAVFLKERVERILHAFDLEAIAEPAGADSAAHEHRGVLITPGDRPEVLSSEEIVEFLRDDWRLVLNVDPDENVDDDGNPLGTTPWIALVRFDPPVEPETDEEVPDSETASDDGAGPETSSDAMRPGDADDGEEDAAGIRARSTRSDADRPRAAAKARTGVAGPAASDPSTDPIQAGAGDAGSDDSQSPKYAEIVLSADNLREAEDLALDAADDLLRQAEESELEPMIVSVYRLTGEDLADVLGRRSPDPVPDDLSPSRVFHTQWL